MPLAWYSTRRVRATSIWQRRPNLARAVPPFVSIVGLFVNADPAVVRATLAAVPIHTLQLHGDEDEAYCRQFDRPYIKAARVRPGMDLLQYAAAFPGAQAILLDAFVDGYGGGGKVFDWSLVPPALGKPMILSGGLDAGNVGDAVCRCGRRRSMSRRASRRAKASRMSKRCVPLWPPCGRLAMSGDDREMKS